MSKFFIRYRHWLLALTFVLAIVSGVLAFFVNINTDMSKYLPDDSHMRAGLSIINEEFDSMAEMGGNNVRVLCKDLSDDERLDMMVSLRKHKDVNGVNELENGAYTLYELDVSGSIDQVAMGKDISSQYPKVQTVETSQDGASAEAPMLLGGLSFLLVILFAMCKSWLEPALFLVSTGIAVLINTGTNALLPSVSVTTNSIAAVLQLVLSMDYSIILINRFRQEKLTTTESTTAMQNAIKRAASSIVSSAFTTIVGLIMLMFMKLKIGADVGIVLSKGVLCSLVCNFTILPSLILIFEKGIEKSTKKVLSIPMDKVANSSLRLRIPLTILFVVIFVGSFILRSQTNIIFLNAKDSKIEKYFPKKNPVIIVYDNADEAKVPGMLDNIMKDPNVEMVLSYPSLLQREYTAPQMVEAIKELAPTMANMDKENTPMMNLDMLTDDVLKVAYFAAHDSGKELTMTFNEMADFILQQSLNPNSLLAKEMDDDMKSKIKMLDELRHPVFKELSAPDTKATEPQTAESKPTEKHIDIELSPKTTESPVRSDIVSAPTQQVPSSPYADTALIQKPMTATEIASFLNMDAGQAKSAFKLAKRSGQTMTPVEFIHFITENILQRRALAAMIKDSQKKQLLAVQSTMDSTLWAASFTTNKENNSLISTITTQKNDPVVATETPIVAADTTPAKPVHHKTTPAKPKANDPFVVLDEMLYGKKEYTAHQMSKNLSILGEDISENLVELLYLYYGGNTQYDDNWTMTLEQLTDFLVHTALHDPRFSPFVDDNARQQLEKVQAALSDGVGKLRSKNHSIAVIITNYSTESPETYRFIDNLNHQCHSDFSKDYYPIGESVMLSEMKAGFNHEMILVTLLTIAAIFLIVAFTFRSILLSAILVMSVMSGVFVNVMVSGFGGGSLLYIAYLIVQSILMGAAIDYGILFASFYREERNHNDIKNSLQNTYKHSINTILTSGLILILVPGVMAILVSDPTVAAILRSIFIGATATVLLILFFVPGVIATFDHIIIKKKKE